MGALENGTNGTAGYDHKSGNKLPIFALAGIILGLLSSCGLHPTVRDTAGNSTVDKNGNLGYYPGDEKFTNP